MCGNERNRAAGRGEPGHTGASPITMRLLLGCEGAMQEEVGGHHFEGRLGHPAAGEARRRRSGEAVVEGGLEHPRRPSAEEELQRLGRFEGVEAVCLDFAIDRKDVAIQSDVFDAELLWRAGALDIDLVVSHYA